MELRVGKVYQSRSFPHISRKVVSVKDGIVIYSIIDDRKPGAMFRKMATAVESEFCKVSAT